MIYAVTVKPNSRKGPLVVEATTHDQQDKPELTVYLREKPIEGAANVALISVLAEHFHIAKNRITIKSGAHGRHKLVEID